jgi:hypothetical protein
MKKRMSASLAFTGNLMGIEASHPALLKEVTRG